MNVSAFETAYLSRINTIMQSEEINLRVANALRFVVQNVFGNITNAFVFTFSTTAGATEFWLHDLLTKMFSTWGLIAVQLVMLDSRTKYVDVPGMRFCNMIMVDSYESLKKTNIADYNRNSNSLEYYFIFLQSPDKLLERETSLITRYCFDNYLIHCNIMAQNARGEILVYTYFPFKKNNCFKTQPELVNRFLENEFENTVMFPDKLKDLQGCPLKLSTWPTEPFVMNETNRRKPTLPIAGFEIFTLMTVSEKMNFSIDVEWVTIETYDQNKSPETAPLSKLENYDTNFTMGYFRRTAERDEIATPTYTTYYIPLSAIILRKEAHHDNIGIWTFPFDTTTWIMIFIVYIFIGFLNFFQDKKIKDGIFEIFEVIIGIPVNNVPKWISLRIQLMTAILSSFILRSVYQSLLFYIFRTNFYLSPPMTFEGLVHDGYTAVATELSLRFLINIPQIDDRSLPLLVINNTDEMHPLRHLQLFRNESLVAMSIVEFAIRFVREELATDDALQILPINVKDQQICFYLPKHSYLSERLNQFILRLHQAGLYPKWREWVLYDYQVFHGDASSEYQNALMVNLSQLLGFLFLIIFILSASTLLFIMEFMSKKVKWLQKFF